MKMNARLREEFRRLVPPADRLKISAACLRDLARIDIGYARKDLQAGRWTRRLVGTFGALQLAFAVSDLVTGARWSVCVGSFGLAVGFLMATRTETVRLRTAARDLEHAEEMAEDAEATLSELIAESGERGRSLESGTSATPS